MHTDAIPWSVIHYIHLNEDETTSSSRIFIKILFQELAEFMGLQKLNERIRDQTMMEHFEGIFPKDNPRNARFAINFFTSIGLGGLTYVLFHPPFLTLQGRSEGMAQDSAEEGRTPTRTQRVFQQQ